MNLLVVEDEILLKHGYQNIISNLIPGINMEWASSVSEAKNLLENNFYEISFLDIRLNDRGQSGLTVIPHLISKNTMVVILSGISESTIKHRALIRGAKEYVVKDGARSVVTACELAIHHYSKMIVDNFFQTFYKHTPELEKFTREFVEAYIFDKKCPFLVKGELADKYVKKLLPFLKKNIALKRDCVYLTTDVTEQNFINEHTIFAQTSTDFANIVLNRLKEKNVVLQNIVYDMLTRYNWKGGEREAIKLSDHLLKKWKRLVPISGIPSKYRTTEDNKLNINVCDIPNEMEELIIKHGWKMGIQMIKKMIMVHMFNKFDRSYSITGQNINVSRKTVWSEINGGDLES